MSDVENLQPNYERMKLVKSQDVRNIRRMLVKCRYSRLYNGIVSWMNNINCLGCTSPILFFKEKDIPDTLGMLEEKDVVLIIMTEFQQRVLSRYKLNKISFDATHCGQDYDFQLVTLFGANDTYSWCPISFCITSRIDHMILKYFLVCLRKIIGFINCSIFLSADDPMYYEAWCSVMSKPIYRFLHFWVVDEDWKANLLKVYTSDNVKQATYNTLSLLLTETQPVTFEKTMHNLYEELLSSKSTMDFGYYFKDVYMNRPLLWAHCYRIGLRLEMETYLASLHKKLNHHYHEGLTNYSLEECINILIKIGRDCNSISTHLLDMCKDNKNRRIVNIKESHKIATANQMNIKEIVLSSYEVKCPNQNETYIVQYLNTNLCDCFLTCKDCNICIHSYSCTCGDNIVHYNLCEHIHACAMFRNSLPSSIIKEDNHTVLEGFVEEVICEEIICEEIVNDTTVDEDISEQNIIYEEVDFHNVIEGSISKEDVSDVIENCQLKNLIKIPSSFLKTNYSVKNDWNLKNDIYPSESIDGDYTIKLEIDTDNNEFEICELSDSSNDVLDNHGITITSNESKRENVDVFKEEQHVKFKHRLLEDQLNFEWLRPNTGDYLDDVINDSNENNRIVNRDKAAKKSFSYIECEFEGPENYICRRLENCSVIKQQNDEILLVSTTQKKIL